MGYSLEHGVLNAADYQQGQMTANHNRFLGFTKDEKGQLIVDPDEAVEFKSGTSVDVRR